MVARTTINDRRKITAFPTGTSATIRRIICVSASCRALRLFLYGREAVSGARERRYRGYEAACASCFAPPKEEKSRSLSTTQIREAQPKIETVFRPVIGCCLFAFPSMCETILRKYTHHGKTAERRYRGLHQLFCSSERGEAVFPLDTRRYTPENRNDISIGNWLLLFCQNVKLSLERIRNKTAHSKSVSSD